jgi:DNA-binding SARP family transcriptional activator
VTHPSGSSTAALDAQCAEDELLALWRSGARAALADALTRPKPGLSTATQDRWRALLGLLQERIDVLAMLDRAWQADTQTDRLDDARRTAQMALAACLLDHGAMDQVSRWLERLGRQVEVDAELPAQTARSGSTDEQTREAADFWRDAADLAARVFGSGAQEHSVAAAQRFWAQLRAPDSPLCPNERLIAGQLLVHHHFVAQAYEKFGLLASAIEEPVVFVAASPLLQVRWRYALGYALYQVGEVERAQRSWQGALELCETHGLTDSALMVSLALTRLQLDQGEVAAAKATLEAIHPDWGLGRVSQLIALQQMRARAQLLSIQPARALALLNEALELARGAGLPEAETASCRTDLAQALHALGREAEAIDQLDALRTTHSGRDAEVFGCLHGLLRAWALHVTEPVVARSLLEQPLDAAQRLRYSMFLRLLPQRAADLCSLALRWQVQPVFVAEIARARHLPAPEDAGAQWPWPVWVRLLGGFELRIDGVEPAADSKAQQRPLELLRMLAVERRLSISLAAAVDALWPEASGDAARKSLDMTVARLRKLLGAADRVLVSDGRVSLNRNYVQSDVALRRKLIDGLETLSNTPQAADPAKQAAMWMEQIGALGQDELLPELPETPWVQAARTRCAQETVRAAHAAARLLAGEQAGEIEIGLLEAALHYEPLAQTLVHRLMQAHVARGTRGDALRVLRGFERSLAALNQPLPERTRALAIQMGLIATHG